MAAAPSARRASPSARGRSRRRATDGGGTQPTPETSVASQPATGLGTPTVQPNQGEPGWVGNIKRLAGRPWMRLPPRRAHPHPPAAGRRRTTGGGVGNAKRVTPPNRRTRKYRPAHLRHGRAGCASPSRWSGRPPTSLARPSAPHPVQCTALATRCSSVLSACH